MSNVLQVRDIMSLIVFCVVTERKQSYDTHPIRSLATNTMLKVSKVDRNCLPVQRILVTEKHINFFLRDFIFKKTLFEKLQY